MGQRTCSVDGCEREAEKRGWCSRHYQRWRNHGDPLGGGPILGPRNAGRPCTVDDCDRPAAKRGWCDLHYRRWLKNGDPLIVLKVSRVDAPCSIEGCGREHYGLGLCQLHYQRERQRSGARCSVPGCGQGAHALGLCNKHFLRARKHGDPLVIGRAGPKPRVGPKPACTMEGCDKPAAGRGLCKAHWAAWSRATFPDRAADYVEKRRARKLAAFVDDVKRAVVFERDEGICGICGTPVDPKRFHVDHIIALAKGGEHSYANVQLAHPACNHRKGDRAAA